jgi:hypothetical protein
MEHCNARVIPAKDFTVKSQTFLLGCLLSFHPFALGLEPEERHSLSTALMMEKAARTCELLKVIMDVGAPRNAKGSCLSVNRLATAPSLQNRSQHIERCNA